MQRDCSTFGVNPLHSAAALLPAAANSRQIEGIVWAAPSNSVRLTSVATPWGAYFYMGLFSALLIALFGSGAVLSFDFSKDEEPDEPESL